MRHGWNVNRYNGLPGNNKSLQKGSWEWASTTIRTCRWVGSSGWRSSAHSDRSLAPDRSTLPLTSSQTVTCVIRRRCLDATYKPVTPALTGSRKPIWDAAQYPPFSGQPGAHVTVTSSRGDNKSVTLRDWWHLPHQWLNVFPPSPSLPFQSLHITCLVSRMCFDPLCLHLCCCSMALQMTVFKLREKKMFIRIFTWNLKTDNKRNMPTAKWNTFCRLV